MRVVLHVGSNRPPVRIPNLIASHQSAPLNSVGLYDRSVGVYGGFQISGTILGI